MKEIKRETFFALIVAAVIFHSVFSAAVFGQKVVAENESPKRFGAEGKISIAPRIFAPGIVSTKNNEFGGGLSPDGKSFYFARSVPRSYLYAIFVSELKKGSWSKPQIAAFSGQHRDFDAVFAPDGKRMYFISDRRISPEKPQLNYDLWFLEKTGDGWSEPRHAGATLNSAGNEWFASVATSGTIYLSSARGNAPNDSDIYRVPLLADGSHGEPENLGEAVNSPGFETEAYIAPDESFVIFSSIRPEGFGDFDLYISRRESGKWTKAENLGAAVNTSARDYSPRLSPDGKTLFFTSERNFATVFLQKPLTYSELQDNLRSPFNGLGNIYQISTSVIAEKRD